MNDFSSGPLEMTVEKTADEQTMVKVDQANPISFQQNIPPRNANRYMTNGSGSCEDPKVTLLLPSAPGRGVVLRSSHLVPPVWFTENPQDGTPEGNIEKQYVTSPRALPAGLKRKRQDAQSSINNSESRIPADSSPDLEVQSIAHGGFKLMGFPIEPGRYTHQFQGADRMKGPDEKKTALISDSTSETDGDSIDAFLSKQHVDTSSSSPPVTLNNFLEAPYLVTIVAAVASGKPLGAMEKLIFISNFVEMISTIVPKDKETNDIDLELEKALRLVESIYETRQPHELLHHSAIGSQRSDIKARLLGKRNAHASVRLWVLLDIWIETCRTTLSEKILEVLIHVQFTIL
ncbi:hypothetical protein KEM48_002258 [Puccinia striiformis f. sp. tritici PST-130]|nr:hypothetical protein KEM48_002258 [Puccinia striiformis f. sp. tritici PST-130]